MDKETHIRNLLYKYLSNESAEQEQDELLEHLQTPAGKWVFDEVMNAEAGKIFNSQPETETAVSQRMLSRIQQSISQDDGTSENVPFLRKIGLERALAALAGLFHTGQTPPDC